MPIEINTDCGNFFHLRVRVDEVVGVIFFKVCLLCVHSHLQLSFTICSDRLIRTVGIICVILLVDVVARIIFVVRELLHVVSKMGLGHSVGAHLGQRVGIATFMEQ